MFLRIFQFWKPNADQTLAQELWDQKLYLNLPACPATYRKTSSKFRCLQRSEIQWII